MKVVESEVPKRLRMAYHCHPLLSRRLVLDFKRPWAFERWYYAARRLPGEVQAPLRILIWNMCCGAKNLASKYGANPDSTRPRVGHNQNIQTNDQAHHTLFTGCDVL